MNILEVGGAVRAAGKVQANDLAPITRVMDLMQKYAKDDGIVGTDNIDR